MAYKPKDQNSRLSSLERVPYDQEGFNMSFYAHYKFRDDFNKSKLTDKKNKFFIETKPQFSTFDEMRKSFEQRSLTSK
jgi:hypothetical protein